ncbi:FAD-binding oxidoreductase [Poseidonocella sp. HB161398]|uniref:FAD-binding oxidoreductase n=1 Tax=Poseidonocella sp. HB161398 TaxID=2320855 RepID=UPI001108016E|nr:FAD-binding oxidoreductase [Poseidonocella sp. HB161398]
MTPFDARLAAIPDVTVLTGEEEMAPHFTDWRRRYSGRARAVAFPGTVEAVAAVVRLCHETGTPVWPQGGNTGICGGSVPGGDGAGIVLCLGRLNRIRDVSPGDDSITVDAGVTLQAVQEAAEGIGRLFPLSLGAEGSCQIGGNIATNAGGTAVVRYGTMRDLVLGVEAVLADGTVWNGLRSLRKNNTGLDLKQLMIGTEGTLGIVTGATLRLFPRPVSRVTALLHFTSAAEVLETAQAMRAAFPGEVDALELLSASQVEIVARHFPQLALPLPGGAAWSLLVEIAGGRAEEEMLDGLAAALEPMLEAGTLVDAVIGQNARQREAIWAQRHTVTEANVREGMGLTHDIAVPIARIGDFLAEAEAMLAEHYPQARQVVVSHVGDGNLHWIAMFSHEDWAGIPDPEAVQADLDRRAYDIAHAMGGTFSAEHGVGSIHIGEMRRYKDPAELALMRTVKAALDPAGILNPGRVVPA